MDRSCLRLNVLLVVGVIAATSNLSTGQQSPATGTPVRMVVTAEARHGADVPVIQKEDVPFSGWRALRWLDQRTPASPPGPRDGSL